MHRLFKITILLLTISFQLNAQVIESSIEREVVGKLLATTDSIAVAYADVINVSSQKEVSSSMHGIFRIVVKPNDKIAVSAIGYQTDTILGIDLIERANQNIIYLGPAVTVLDEVYISDGIDLGIGKVNDTPVALRGSMSDDARVIDYVSSPVSALHSMSKREKMKKMSREMYNEENTWRSFYDKITVSKIKKITGASDAQVDKFMLVFNTQHKLQPTATENEISERIDYIWKAFVSMEQDKETNKVAIKAADTKTKKRKRSKKKE